MGTTLKMKEVAAPDTLKVIYARRAVRSYSEEELSKATIEQIVDAGRMAPSAMNVQPWKFYVLTDPTLISELSVAISKTALKALIKQGPKKVLKTGIQFLSHLPSSIHMIGRNDPIFYHAPAVLFITAPPNDEWAALDVGMCAENMMLAAKALGVASCPLGFARLAAETNVYARLQIPPTEEVYLAIIFGYAKRMPRAPERIKNNLIYVS